MIHSPGIIEYGNMFAAGFNAIYCTIYLKRVKWPRGPSNGETLFRTTVFAQIS